MNRIYKFKLAITDEQELALPAAARLLCVQKQHGGVCLWALLDTSHPVGARTIRIVGTGHAVPDADRLAYVDTFQLAEGELVFHVFEELP